MTEGGDEKPDFLYHYTSIEGLANILSSKQIRFSRLDLLDDLTEGESLDPVDWRQFYFVSCWTSSEQESIPLWHMYTGNMKGVRLKLPGEMFRLYELDLETVPRAVQLFDPDLVRNNLSGKFLSYLPYARLHTEHYFVTPPSFKNDWWPLQVVYTDEENLLKQKLIEYDAKSDKSSLNAYELGKYKSLVWSFQEEWRFRIFCFNAISPDLEQKLGQDAYFDRLFNRIRDFSSGVPTKYLFLDLSSEALGELEIVLGPKTDEAQKIIVESLVEKYSKSARVTESSLSGKIG